MTARKHISNKLLLGAIFIGLNVLCFVGASHGRHAAQHTRLNYTHITAHGLGRAGSRNSRLSQSVIAVDTMMHRASDSPARHLGVSPSVHAAHALLAGSHDITAHVPAFALLAQQDPLALCSAPRGPSLGRAPPLV